MTDEPDVEPEPETGSEIEKADNWDEKEAELHADLENIVDTLDDEKADAVAALGEAAEESLETREVRLSDDLVLEVKDRLDPRAERQQERAQRAMDDDDLDKATRHASAALAHQILEPEEYTDTEVWETATQMYGRDYILNEVTEQVLGPIIEAAEEKQKKYDQSRHGGTGRGTTR